MSGLACHSLPYGHWSYASPLTSQKEQTCHGRGASSQQIGASLLSTIKGNHNENTTS